MDGSATLDAGPDEVDALILRPEHGGDGAPVALTDGDHGAGLAVLVHGQATVLAIFLPVLRTDVPTDIATVHIDHAAGATVNRGQVGMGGVRISDECQTWADDSPMADA